MPSEARAPELQQQRRRLHPSSILFRLVQQARAFALPAIFVLFGARSSGGNWELWALLLLVPMTIVSLVRYASFRYRYESNELVVETGFVFRNERHVPYARIHDLAAVRNPLHRLLGVVDVRVETGGGGKPEAVLSVLTLADYEEMRERVALGKSEAGAAVSSDSRPLEDVPVTPPEAVLLRMPASEVALWGLIRGQGGVVMAAILGTFWEFGIADRIFSGAGGGRVRDLVREVLRGFTTDRLSEAGGWIASVSGVFAVAAGVAGLLLFVRLLAVVWSLVRFHGFQLLLEGGNLRTEFGLFTRVSASLPRHRIQALIIRESPLHRWFGRVSIRANAAGAGSFESDLEGEGQDDAASSLKEREWIAPLVRRADLTPLVAAILPPVVATGLNLDAIDWQPLHPRAFRRCLRSWLRWMGVVVAVLLPLLGPWTAAALPFLLGWAVLGAHREVRGLGWAMTPQAVLQRSGWLWRRVHVVPHGKIQAISRRSSFWDRRADMARLRLDTAGSGALGERFDIPYLDARVASDLASQLEQRVASIAFRW